MHSVLTGVYVSVHCIDRCVRNCTLYWQVYGHLVEEHKQTFDADSKRDVIDEYLQEYGVTYDSECLIGLFFSFVGKYFTALEINVENAQNATHSLRKSLYNVNVFKYQDS